MRLVPRLKSILARSIKRHGYRLERVLDYSEFEIDVLQLLVDNLNPQDLEFFFVQVGANDGHTGDPIHRFVNKYHWRGLLIEPQMDAFELLKNNYRNERQLILENVALGTQCEMQSLYTLPGASYLAAFDRDSLKRRVRDPAKIIEVRVRVMTWRALLDQHHIRRIDLLVVDTEGYDYELIKLAFQEEIPVPRLIVYEHLHLSSGDRQACAKLLASRGYRLLRRGTDTLASLD